MSGATEVGVIYKRQFSPDLAFRQKMTWSCFTRTISRFVPSAATSRLSRSISVIHMYLPLPLLWRILGQQTFMVAERAGLGDRA